MQLIKALNLVSKLGCLHLQLTLQSSVIAIIYFDQNILFLIKLFPEFSS